jgi:transposase InsO family protein
MAKRSKAWGTRRIYEFIKAHGHPHDVQIMRRALEVLLRLATQAALRQRTGRCKTLAPHPCIIASHGTYGAARVSPDLREAGGTCSKHHGYDLCSHVRGMARWLYLAIVMDLFSRKIVGWANSRQLAKNSSWLLL